MTRREQTEIVSSFLYSNPIVVRKTRAHAGKLYGKARDRLVCVGLRQNRCTQQQSVGLGSDCVCHRDKNAVNLPLLLIKQPRKFIIVFDGFHWFDKNCLSTRTRTVNYAADLAFELSLDRNHEALSAHSDQRILGAAILGQLCQRATQTCLDRAVLLLKRTTNAP